MIQQDILAKQHNLSRRTHSHSWDKEGYLTVTTEVATPERSETFQNVYKCTKADTDLNIKLARAEATDIFLAIEPEVTMATTTAAKTAVMDAIVKKDVAAVIDSMAAGALEEKPVEEPKPAKKKRASRKKAPVAAVAGPAPVEEAPIHIADEVAAEVAPVAEDDGLGDLGEEAAVVNYTKGDKLHSKILGALLVSAYGKDWQKDEKVKVIVRSLVSAIKDTVPVVDDKGTMLGSFSVFVAQFLKAA